MEFLVIIKKKCFFVLGGLRDTENNKVTKVNYILSGFSECNLIWSCLEERRKDNNQSVMQHS